MTLKISWAPPLCYFKLYASFRWYWSIQNGVTAEIRSTRVKLDIFLSRVTTKLGGWPRKTKGHHFYATSSSVHYFTSISKFKLELQSGNAQFGSKSILFVPCDLEIWQMTFKDNRVPLPCATLSFVHHFAAIDPLKLELQFGNTQIGSKLAFFVLCDIEIRRMTLKNNRAPILCCFKLFGSLHNHQ